jgi:hypothetical protein
MGPSDHRLTIVPPLSRHSLALLPRELAASPASTGFLELVESFCRLRVIEAWAELRLCLRDDARLESIAARGVAGPEATIEAMRFAASGNAYAVRDFEIEAVGEQAALVRASISHEERGVVVVSSTLWVVSGRDGLIWRSRVVATREVAKRTLRDEGDELGM